MHKLVICDENKKTAKELKRVILDYMEASYRNLQVEIFSSGEEASAFIKKGGHAEIYLLNVQLPGMDGISVGRLVRDSDERAVLIYMSESGEYAYDTFEVEPLQYLLKPVATDKLFETLEQALDNIQYEESMHFVVKCKKEAVVLPMQKIACVEYHNHQISVTTVDGEVYVSTQAKLSFSHWMEPLLAQPRFIRPHSSFVVNMNCIGSISDAKSFVMMNGYHIPISVNKYTQVRSRYLEYLERGGANQQFQETNSVHNCMAIGG